MQVTSDTVAFSAMIGEDGHSYGTDSAIGGYRHANRSSGKGAIIHEDG